MVSSTTPNPLSPAAIVWSNAPASWALTYWLNTVPTPGLTAYALFAIWRSRVILTTVSACFRIRITRSALKFLDHVPEVAEVLLPEKKAQLVEMKLSGNQDETLYRELLLAQCHALHRAMPFLFEAVDDEAELLLPDNLTRTDSILRDLVDSIPEEDWEDVEVIGWLYQFYISEKKDAVIGKVVKSEDIPAATQLFTPNWIVQYLVQNSVGRQWLQTYPDSPLKGKMDYYIEPAEQTLEVQAQLAAITPASIEPENIKVLDPACGSGHILIEAYNVLKNIYEERGYRARDIPQLILENNIFGLDIDDRAAQLSGFALLMMARQDDRRIFTRDVRLNIVSLQESLHLDIAKLWQQLNFHQQNQTGSMGDMFAEKYRLSPYRKRRISAADAHAETLCECQNAGFVDSSASGRRS
ncbi:Type I restriction-modification system methyltransferase subunit [Klebsiella michiganensis]|uniref:site-specific DNA-methyltransferase (adenine-specific) n=1 Tax=Klebsiella michiganensis TaxID=1134687 RepID=A0A7H4PQD4_9ENTR|nr:Type I restriction-modification system methyltransferase subunit [Klebsiella michiganensis]